MWVEECVVFHGKYALSPWYDWSVVLAGFFMVLSTVLASSHSVVYGVALLFLLLSMILSCFLCFLWLVSCCSLLCLRCFFGGFIVLLMVLALFFIGLSMVLASVLMGWSLYLALSSELASFIMVSSMGLTCFSCSCL